MKTNIIVFGLLVTCASLVCGINVEGRSFGLGNLACGSTSIFKKTTLNHPANNIPALCTYTIRSLNSRVCQARIDFETFSLAQPAIRDYPICEQDVFTVNNMNLCGENSGQHIYVPISSASFDRTLKINIQTLNRQFNASVPAPQWKIQVTMLECPTNYFPANKRIGGSAVRFFNNDANIVAPQGCLQYYTEPAGSFETFNFRNGMGPYLGDMNYAICFHRPQASTKIVFRPQMFELSWGALVDGEGFNDACFSNIESTGRSEDYLQVPFGMVDTPVPTRASLYCGSTVQGKSIVSSLPGPYTVYFNSDKVYLGDTRPEKGFRITYETLGL